MDSVVDVRGGWSARIGADGSDVVALSAELDRLRAENARLQRLLDLRPSEPLPPGPEQTGIFDAVPGPVDNRSSPEKKLAFYRALFAARPDVYAVRWENRRSGKSGWMPAARGGGAHDIRGFSPAGPGANQNRSTFLPRSAIYWPARAAQA